MTRRRLLCGLLLLSAVLACFGGWLLVANGRKGTRARLEQVTKGMSREQVIRIVGQPPGDYASDQTVAIGLSPSGYECWRYDDGKLVVHFDETGKITDMAILDMWYLGPPTFTERIRRWLGL